MPIDQQTSAVEDEAALSDIATNGALFNQVVSKLIETLQGLSGIVLPIANGGTSADNPADALTNLGAGPGDASGPASSITNNIAIFADTTGKLLADGGNAIADLALVDASNITNRIAPSANGISSGDWNTDADEDGWYAGASVANAPTSDVYMGMTIRISANTQYQVLVQTSGPAVGARYHRIRSGGTWGDWITIQGPGGITAITNRNEQSGTTYTLALTDAGGVVEMTNGGANTLTVPPNSSVAFPLNTYLTVTQIGAGQTTIAAGGGVTLRSRNGLLLGGQYAVASMYKRATDEWVIAGDVA